VRFAVILLLVVAVIALVWGLSRQGAGHRSVRLITPPGSGERAEPNLTRGADGRLYLTWVEKQGSEHILWFSRWQDQWREGGSAGWSPPVAIARGADWFVNWADFPGMAALEDGTLFAHWLARMGDAAHAYGVHVAVSRDQGKTWSAPAVPHRDATPAEHGFVSWVPAGSDAMGLIWLDGRDVKEVAGGGIEGTTGLRYTTVDRNGAPGAEVLLDPRVCDCCATTAVVAEPGALLVAYRDRSLEEVRDIAFVRSAAGAWSPPKPVYRDGWKIDGCPVNGPAADAAGSHLAVAWFTAAGNDSGAVEVVFSLDGGRTFQAPIRVDGGNPLGRVDVVVEEGGSALVSWLEDTGRGDAEIRLREVTPEGKLGRPITAARTRSERASGFPRMERLGDRVYLAWTEAAPTPTIKTAVFD
jgi:hypothetical protein